jgi:ADP-ribosylglycohydrolase
MLGSIIGDIIGSTYEFRNTSYYDFDPFPPGSDFTDDTVLTIAIAGAILNHKGYVETVKEYALKYPNRGYGGWFTQWIHLPESKPYNSFGNGSAMRVSSIGWAFESIERTVEEAGLSAAITHNHPEGIKGAESVAAAIFLARNGSSKKDIKDFISKEFNYDLERSLESIKPFYHFNETCQKTVPEAIICFLESVDFEDAIRKAIWLGGDSDTLACITGGLAEAFYKEMPDEWIKKGLAILDKDLIEVFNNFRRTYMFA